MTGTGRSAAVFTLLVVLAAHPLAGAIRCITRGDRVELADHLVPGRYVLVDFFADWCGPCRALEPHLESLAAGHGERLQVLQVDIIRWGSPVAEQYRIRSVPHLKLFDPEGRLIVEGGAGTVLAELEARLGAVPDRARGGGDRGGPGIPLATAAVVVGVAVLLVASGRRRRAREVPAAQPARVRSAADPRRVWFAVVQGVLEGPFTPDELEDLVRKGLLTAASRVRRKGDARWQSLGQLR